MLKGTAVELSEMLACRERRAELQRAFRERYRSPLLSFTLNVPGAVKTTPELRRLFADGLALVHRRLREMRAEILAESESHVHTGDEALLAVDGVDAAALKVAMTALEDARPVNRLFDLDVIDAEGAKLSRPTARRCLLCGEVAAACARSRRHSVEELAAEVARLLAEGAPC